ncbi:MAG TPA: site-2 protease family protein [Acidobacteriaceae bacterium]
MVRRLSTFDPTGVTSSSVKPAGAESLNAEALSASASSVEASDGALSRAAALGSEEHAHAAAAVLTPVRSADRCGNCGGELEAGALACGACHSLVHSERLDQLAKDARALEMRGLLRQARELWVECLPLLPANSKQTEWVHTRLKALDDAIAQAEAAARGETIAPAKVEKPTPTWVKKLGPFGPLALLLFKLKTVFIALLKFKFLFSFFAYAALYVGLFGWRFGIGFAVCVLIHEMGHYVDVKRRGLPAEMPIFLPGLGAYVRWRAMHVSLRTMAQVSLAGPLAGWIAAAVCFLIYSYTQDPLWAALARTGAILNVLNLTPVWVFDGGIAGYALDAMQRAALLMTCLWLWYYTREGFFLLVAAAFAWRLFTAVRKNSDAPPMGDWGVWLYYAAVLVALGVLFHAVPAIGS